MTETPWPTEPFTTASASHVGMRRWDVHAAVREGILVRPLREVFVRADVELTMAVRVRALALVVNESLVVCDRTASWLWDVDCFEYRELDAAPPLEAYVLRGRRAIERPEVDGGSRDLRPEDWVEINGVKVTTPLRTAMDLGCKLNRRHALAAMDALMRAHEFSHADMRKLLPRYFRRRGVLQLRELIPVVDPRAESGRESWTRLEIHDHGLSTPEPEFWVTVRGVPTYRLDLAYPHARIAIEYNGKEFHDSEEQRSRDKARREWLERNGWYIIVLDKDSFTEEALAEWIADLRARLAEAQRRPRRWYAASRG